MSNKLSTYDEEKLTLLSEENGIKLYSYLYHYLVVEAESDKVVYEEEVESHAWTAYNALVKYRQVKGIWMIEEKNGFQLFKVEEDYIVKDNNIIIVSFKDRGKAEHAFEAVVGHGRDD